MARTSVNGLKILMGFGGVAWSPDGKFVALNQLQRQEEEAISL